MLKKMYETYNFSDLCMYMHTHYEKKQNRHLSSIQVKIVVRCWYMGLSIPYVLSP